MSEYRLEKVEEDIVLFLNDGVVLEGVVFLSPLAYGHSGRQTLLELLLEVERFLPVRDREGQVRLINRQSITHVRYVPGEDEEHSAFGKQAGVRLVFFGGEALEGTVTLDIPEEKLRIKDYLNMAPTFFALDSGHAHYIINSHHTHQAIPL